jgi:hypothetical protein
VTLGNVVNPILVFCIARRNRGLRRLDAPEYNARIDEEPVPSLVVSVQQNGVCGVNCAGGMTIPLNEKAEAYLSG